MNRGGGGGGGGGEGGFFLENLFFLATALGTFLILGWVVLRIIAGVVQRASDALMAEIRLTAGMRYPNYHSDDKLYQSLLKVLDPHMGDDYKNRAVTLTSKQLQNGKEDYEFSSPPGYGLHYIQYKSAWVRIERRQTPEVKCEHVPFEYISLSTYKWNKELLYDLLKEAKESQREHDEKRTTFYFISYCSWESFGDAKRRRVLDSVITARGVKELLVKDVNEFLTNEEWYMDRGIPYRRGYLLHGPPGTGKSSLIRAIAGEIGYDICILSLSAKDLTDDGLNRLMNTTPEKCIILLEDVDAAFKSRKKKKKSVKKEVAASGDGCLNNDDDDDEDEHTNHLAYEGAGGSTVTFRGLLNALDGVASTEGRLIFITTNHLDRLDPALIRPGRVDLKLHVDYPNASQITRMFKRFYPQAKGDGADTLLHILMGMDKKISMAAIQGLFLMFKNDPDQAILHAEEYLNHEYFARLEEEQEECDEETNKDQEVELIMNQEKKE